MTKNSDVQNGLSNMAKEIIAAIMIGFMIMVMILPFLSYVFKFQFNLALMIYGAVFLAGLRQIALYVRAWFL